MQNELGIPNTTETLGYIVVPEPFEEVNAELPYDAFSPERCVRDQNIY